MLLSYSSFLNWNLVHTLLVASALKGCGEELVHNLTSHIVVDKATWHHEYIGIVVLTDEMSNLRNPAQTSTYLLVLVQRDADTFTRATDSNARINLATLDTLSQCMTEIGLID